MRCARCAPASRLTPRWARCPAAARAGTQALSFHALRRLGAAQTLRAALAPKAPPPAVDALLLTALALLWPPGEPPYAAHTLVDQAVDAAPRAQAWERGFRQRGAVGVSCATARRARRWPRCCEPLARFNHPAWWVEALQRDWPDRWQAIVDADNQRAPMTLRVKRPLAATAPGYVARLARALDGRAGDRLARSESGTAVPVDAAARLRRR